MKENNFIKRASEETTLNGIMFWLSNDIKAYRENNYGKFPSKVKISENFYNKLMDSYNQIAHANKEVPTLLFNVPFEVDNSILPNQYVLLDAFGERIQELKRIVFERETAGENTEPVYRVKQSNVSEYKRGEVVDARLIMSLFYQTIENSNLAIIVLDAR